MHYCEELSHQQIQDFLTALSFVMHADGESSEEEKEYIKVAALAYGLDEPDFDLIMRKRSLEEVIKKIAWLKEKPTTARYMIREMISLALADGEFLEEELAGISHVSKAVGISEKRLNDMIDWAVEGYEWQIEGFRLIEEDE